MARMNLLKKEIKDAINRLEENYHFDLKEYSFIFNLKIAFIRNIRENIKLIYPFVNERKALGNMIDSLHTTSEGGVFKSPDLLHNYITKSMEIIANMLDHEKMGSVEYYLDHIWKKYDQAIKEINDTKPMQDFIVTISDIIRMIDYSVETQLSNMNELQREGLVAQSLMQNENPDLEIAGFVSIGNDGKMYQTLTKTKKEKEIGLKNMRPINTKVI